MKSTIFIALLFIFPMSICSQSLEQLQTVHQTWGGHLTYQNQTTEFYLSLQHGEDGNWVANTYMPVVPFPARSSEIVSHSDSLFSAGSIQFKLDTNGQLLSGSFPASHRDIRFELTPIAELPAVKEPVSSRSTATPAWTFKTAGAIWGDASADHKDIYIGSVDGNLYSLSQSSGELQWKTKVDGSIFSRPLVHSGHIYILSDEGTLYKLKSTTGSPVWTFDIGGKDWQRKLPNDDAPGYDSMASSPAIMNGLLYVGSADGHLYAIEINSGTEKWRFKSEGPVHSSPVVAEEKVFFGSYDHHVYALDATNGELIWKFDTGQVIVSSPVFGNGRVIIGSRSADLFALNALTGEEEWRYFHWGSWIESSGTIFDNKLYIGSSDDQRLKSFHPESGRLIWEVNLGGSPWTTPALTESTVYAGTFGNANYGIDHRGGFFAVDRLTGKEKWRFMWEKNSDTGIYGVVSSPVVANHMVFFGGLDGVVYGFNIEN